MTLSDQVAQLRDRVVREREEIKKDFCDLVERAEAHYEAARMFRTEKDPSEKLFTCLRNAAEALKPPRPNGDTPDPENGEAVDTAHAERVREAKGGRVEVLAS